MQKKSIVAVGAHPDDIEYGCAGLLAKAKQEDWTIHYILVTEGENWQGKHLYEQNVRMQEQRTAMELLNVNSIHLCSSTDGGVQVNSNIVGRIRGVLDEIGPSIVLTHYFNDSHQDHRAVSQIVRSACGFKHNLLYFDTFTATEFNPTVFVDISDVIAVKKEILNCYQSQIKKYITNNLDFVDAAISSNRIYGMKLSTRYAEGYMPSRFNISFLF